MRTTQLRHRRRQSRPRRLALATALAAVVAVGASAAPPGSSATATTRTGAGLDLGPCDDPGLDGFSCGTLTVPLDHDDPGGRQLELPFTVQNGSSDRPILLFLTGGPGESGVSFAPSVREWVAPVLDRYRLAMIDQRGTGGTAIDCPGLQAEMSEFDLVTPTQESVEECSDIVGDDREFYGTDDTVRDLDALRQALGVRKMAVDGVSYGTYAAEHYALAYPRRVSHLVLDSVVPHQWTPAGSLQLANMRGARRVLDLVCEEQDCTTDPVADLAYLDRQRDDGPAILNLLAILSVIQPDMAFVPDMLHQARTGHPEQLDGWLDGLASHTVPIEQFSQGLHAATLCQDQIEPWGGPEAPFEVREKVVATLPELIPRSSTYPYDADTAVDNGLVQVCRWWDPMPGAEHSLRRNLPAVPTLFVIGDHDLSTSLEWGREEVRRSPTGHLVIARGSGHSVQSHHASFPDVMQRVYDLLLS